MERIYRESTASLPLIDFMPEGNLKIEGRSIQEDAVGFFSPLIEFVDALNVSNVILDINLEYFNTSTSKKLLDLFRHLETNDNIQNILINWYFEEGDDDSLETAEIYEECLLRIDFRYHEYAEVA
ncbi:MAG: DUF1987 domain-containing protein [Bacteroidales bacterium]|jgi:hypothetical protein